MDSIDLEIRSIDHEVNEKLARSKTRAKTVSINKQTTFALHTRLDAGQASDCFLSINKETEKVKHLFSDMIDEATGSPIGFYKFNDVYILGRPGVIADVHNKVCWIGYSLGWNLNLLKAAVAGNRLGEVIDDRILRLNKNLLRTADASFAQSSHRAAHLISAPGYAVYGHWLADTVPRLHLRANNADACRAPIYCPNTAPWGVELADIFGADLTRMPRLGEGRCVRVHSLDLLSCIKSNRVFDSATANAAWDVLRQTYASDVAPSPRKIYVSRSQLASQRKLENAAELERYFSAMGWQVIHPETLSLAEQASIFSRASTIVGEDGSALHNSIYSPAGTKILCLDFHRENMFHASFANALRHKIAYLRCDKARDDTGPGQWNMPIARLSETIKLIEEN